MNIICKVGMVLTTISGALAIVLMWLLYPREVDWVPTLDASITFMQAQMSGALPPDHRVDWRSDTGLQYKSIVITSPGIRSNFKPCALLLHSLAILPGYGGFHLVSSEFLLLCRYVVSQADADAGCSVAVLHVATCHCVDYHNQGMWLCRYENPNMPAFNATVDLSQGFYEDGPWGPVKLTKNNGFTTAMLAWAMLDAKESFQESRDLTVRTPGLLQLSASE